MRRVVSVALALAAFGFSSGHLADATPRRRGDEAMVFAALAAAMREAPLEQPALSPFERTVAERMGALGEVMVEVEMQSGGEVVGHGSGVFVSSSGDVLTAAHVVSHPGYRFEIVVADGRKRAAEVVARDVGRDVALLRTRGPATPFVRMSSGTSARGAWVVCAGFGGEVAAERAPMRSVGVVADTAFTWSVVEFQPGRYHFPVQTNSETFAGMVRTDCGTAPGMSGGPVVGLDGELVGIVVGSGGVISPVSGFRRLVPAATTPRSSTAVAPSSPKPVDGADGSPSREATLAPAFAAVGRSLVELAPPKSESSEAPFTGVLVSRTGLVVAPSVRLPKSRDAKTLPPCEIAVGGAPRARCVEVVAVRGELALLRFVGLVDSAHRPIAPGHEAALGELVAAVAAGAAPPRYGFVTSALRHPGTVAPDGPRWGCGTHRAMFFHANPPVDVGAAIANDAVWSGFGSLLVDAGGRPVAIDVASRAPGLSFAVPWSDVVARFRPWLAVVNR